MTRRILGHIAVPYTDEGAVRRQTVAVDLALTDRRDPDAVYTATGLPADADDAAIIEYLWALADLDTTPLRRGDAIALSSRTMGADASRLTVADGQILIRER